MSQPNKSSSVISKHLHGDTPNRRPKIFYGWWLVGIAAITLTVVITPIFQGLGTFFVALERAFGWSRASLSVPFSLARAEGALLGPIEGYLTDRLGPRFMILFGFFILGAGLIAFSFIQTLIGYYITFLVMFAGASLGGVIPFMASINNWFVRHRAKAMGIGMAGINMGGLLVPLLALAITNYGWERAALSVGLGIWLIAIPVTFLVRGRPEDYGQLPDGDHPNNQQQDPDGMLTSTPNAFEDQGNFTIREALRTTAFWTITTAHGCSSLAAVTISVHIIPAMTDIGMSLTMAGTVVMVYGVLGGIFQIIGGFMGDRLPKPVIIAVFIAIQGTGMLVVALIHTTVGAFLFAILFGIGFGGRIPLVMAIRGDYFGRKNFATLWGISHVPTNIVMIGAPVAAGYLFDTMGSYTLPFLALAVFNFIGSVLILFTKQPTLPEHTPLPNLNG